MERMFSYRARVGCRLTPQARRRVLSPGLLLGVLVLLGAMCIGSAVCAGAVLYDDFNGSTIDTTKWTTRLQRSDSSVSVSFKGDGNHRYRISV